MNKMRKLTIDKKQWIPLYGIYQVMKDVKEGNPNVTEDPLTYVPQIFLQAASISTTIVGICSSLEMLLK